MKTDEHFEALHRRFYFLVEEQDNETDVSKRKELNVQVVACLMGMFKMLASDVKSLPQKQREKDRKYWEMRLSEIEDYRKYSDDLQGFYDYYSALSASSDS